MQTKAVSVNIWWIVQHFQTSPCNICHFKDLVHVSSKRECHIGFMDAAIKNGPKYYILCIAYQMVKDWAASLMRLTCFISKIIK